MHKPLTILVLEDEFIIADEIASTIEDAGHAVLGPAASVEEALRLLATETRPDVAIIDANLRGETSLPVAERLREQSVPFCVCTGYRTDVLQKSFGNDVVVLQKPVTPNAVVAALRALVAS
jgi:DNA-binding response OmpR family regulator